MISAVVVDDEEDMRVLLRHVLASRDIAIVGEADGPDAAIALWREHRPDIVVLDQRMAGRTGIDVADEMLREVPDQVIFLFTAFADPEVRAAARDAGITACLSKNEVFSIPELAYASLKPA
jgi:CheY-like chemotaxis protein